MADWSKLLSYELDNISTENVHEVYRINSIPCPKEEKRSKNCRNNPRCFHNLGGDLWWQPFDESKVKLPNALSCPKTRSDHSHPIGLQNLGATCYLNCHLQRWFHDIDFRRIILRQYTEDDSSDSDFVYQLKRLFALMQNSKRSAVSPTAFASSLGLSSDEQQDVAEFSVLFLSRFESIIEQRGQLDDANKLKSRNTGEYSYITECSNCNNAYERPESLAELTLSITSCLEDSIKAAFAPEPLKGENQVWCDICQSKQNSSRSLQIKNPPEILSIQLRRIFWKGFTKIKSHKRISYPLHIQLLDIDYYLTSVIFHKGSHATSGHYVCDILDPVTEHWFNFDDEFVTRIELDDKRKSHSDAERRTSADVYLLEYKKVSSKQHQLAHPTLDDTLAAIVESHNMEVEDAVSDFEDQKKSLIDSKFIEHEEIHLMLINLEHFLEDEPVFIPTEWLRKWFSDPNCCQSISTQNLICEHEALDPHNVGEVKLVSLQGLNSVIHSYGIVGPILRPCVVCINDHLKEKQLAERISNAQILIAEILKNSSTPSYIVGKRSFKKWRSLAKEKDFSDGGFNLEIVCPHSNLIPDVTRFKIIPMSAWELLKSFFPTAPEFISCSPVCVQCKEQMSSVSTYKDVLSSLKQPRSELYQTSVVYRLIDSRFVDILESYIISINSNETVGNLSLANSSLLCSHSKLCIDIQSSKFEDAWCAVTPKMWSKITLLAQVDHEITFTINKQTSSSQSIELVKGIISTPLFSKLSNHNTISENSSSSHETTVKEERLNKVSSDDLGAVSLPHENSTLEEESSQSSKLYDEFFCNSVVRLNKLSADKVYVKLRKSIELENSCAPPDEQMQVNECQAVMIPLKSCIQDSEISSNTSDYNYSDIPLKKLKTMNDGSDFEVIDQVNLDSKSNTNNITDDPALNTSNELKENKIDTPQHCVDLGLCDSLNTSKVINTTVEFSENSNVTRLNLKALDSSCIETNPEVCLKCVAQKFEARDHSYHSQIIYFLPIDLRFESQSFPYQTSDDDIIYQGLRRSKRVPKPRNQITLHLSSTDLVKNVKLQLLTRLSQRGTVALFNYDCSLVSNDEATLFELGIARGSQLYYDITEEVVEEVKPETETGFSGTVLVG